MVTDNFKSEKRKRKLTIVGLVAAFVFMGVFYGILKLQVVSTELSTEFQGLSANDEIEYHELKEGIYIGSVCEGAISGVGTLYYFNGNIYKGELVEKLRNGSGTLVWNNGNVYTGEFEEDHLSGTGTYTYSDGTVYVGEFVSGKRSGTGMITYTDGAKYDGEWNEDQYFGTGVYTYPDGNIVEGEFSDNRFSGNGSYTSKDADITYKVRLKKGKRYGILTLTLQNGDEYRGKYKNGSFSGIISVTYSNGDKYTGHVVDGLKSGIGKYTWVSGARYEGEWSSDKMNGRGEYIYTSSVAPYLNGKFKNNKPSGTCEYHYSRPPYSFNTKWSKGVCNRVKVEESVAGIWGIEEEEQVSVEKVSEILVPQENQSVSVTITVDIVDNIVPPKTQE